MYTDGRTYLATERPHVGVREVELRRQEGRPRGVTAQKLERPYDVQHACPLLEHACLADSVRRLRKHLDASKRGLNTADTRWMARAREKKKTREQHARGKLLDQTKAKLCAARLPPSFALPPSSEYIRTWCLLAVDLLTLDASTA